MSVPDSKDYRLLTTKTVFRLSTSAVYKKLKPQVTKQIYQVK